MHFTKNSSKSTNSFSALFNKKQRKKTSRKRKELIQSTHFEWKIEKNYLGNEQKLPQSPSAGPNLKLLQM